MKRFFVISDTHFSHEKILTFTDNFGGKLRDFHNIEEMDECIIDNWNSVVRNEDEVYHLGDVGFNRNKLRLILPRLNGKKVLVKGNHDRFSKGFYSEFFADIRAVSRMDGIVMSHIPIHPACLSRWGTNVHGHLHSNHIVNGPYVNVCVEQINYTPKDLEEIIYEIKSKG